MSGFGRELANVPETQSLAVPDPPRRHESILEWKERMLTKSVSALNSVAANITTCFVSVMSSTADAIQGGAVHVPLPQLPPPPLFSSPPPLQLPPPPPRPVPRLDNGGGAARQSPLAAVQVSPPPLSHWHLLCSAGPDGPAGVE